MFPDNPSQRIKSLRDPGKKMSKSSKNPKDRIEILDEPDILMERVKKAVTDCTSEVTYEPDKRPGVANLIDIHSMLTGKTPNEICLETQGLDTGKYVLRAHRIRVSPSHRFASLSFIFWPFYRYKLVLADLLIETLSPIREEFSKLIKEPVYLQEVLKDGTEKATEIATACWYRVKNKVGFRNDIVYINEENVENAMHKM